MPIHFAIKGHPAECKLTLLGAVATAQNAQFGKIREAAVRMSGLATETDREEYRQLCAQMQRIQSFREMRLRAEALEAGASPKLVRKQEQLAERTFSGHY